MDTSISVLLKAVILTSKVNIFKSASKNLPWISNLSPNVIFFMAIVSLFFRIILNFGFSLRFYETKNSVKDFFLNGLSFMKAGNLHDSRGKDWTVFISLYYFQPLTNNLSFISNFVFSIVLHVITRLLLGKMDHLQEFAFKWLLIEFYLQLYLMN